MALRVFLEIKFFAPNPTNRMRLLKIEGMKTKILPSAIRDGELDPNFHHPFNPRITWHFNSQLRKADLFGPTRSTLCRRTNKNNVCSLNRCIVLDLVGCFSNIYGCFHYMSVLKTNLQLIIGLYFVAALNSAAARELTLNDLFPTDRVLDVRITVDEEDWDKIRFQSRNIFTALQEKRKHEPIDGPYTYVHADVTIDGVEFPGVGIRKKGFIGSQSSLRPSLKIKLNHVDKKGGIEGLTNLTFNNNKQDTSQMSQFMGYALFNAAGSPASRCAYAKITVNGTNLGVYSHVESIRKPMLKRAFGKASGTLYEGTVVDFHEGWQGSFEKKIGKDKPGREKIEQLIEVMQGVEGDTILGSNAGGRGWATTGGQYDDQWTRLDFDDSDWRSGRNGAGYDQESNYRSLIDDALDFKDAMFDKTESLYLRFSFEIDDLDKAVSPANLILKMKYDDGFVAYLNGHKVASSNAPEDTQWDSAATRGHNDPAAMTFESFNISEHKDKLLYGRNVLAIHGLNIDSASTDMLIVAEIQSSDHNDEQAIGKLVDLDAFYTFWAVEGLLGFWDGYSGNRNNFFFYLNPATDKFHFLPWGADRLFEKFSRLEVDRRAPLSVKTLGLITYKLYQIKSCRERYARTLMELMDKHWDEEALLAETDRIEAMLEPHLTSSQKQTNRIDGIRKFISNRRSDLVNEIANGMPIWTAAPEEPPILSADDFRGDRSRREGKPKGKDIWSAAKMGNLADIEQLLGDGIDVNARDESGGTPLGIAALSGQTEAVAWLIENDADVNSKTNDNSTALHGASFLGQLEVVKLLVRKGADVNARNSRGETPLDTSAAAWSEEIQGFVEFIATILQIKVDVAKVKTGRPEVAAFLRDNGGKVAAELTKSAEINIWGAAKSGDTNVLMQQLTEGANANALDAKGITPLSWSAMADQTETVGLLIQHGAKVNGKNRDGSTPLHGAAFLGRTEMVELLLKKRANVNARNNEGETPLGTVAPEWNEGIQGIVQFIAGILEIKVDLETIKAARPRIAQILRKQGGKTGEQLR